MSSGNTVPVSNPTGQWQIWNFNDIFTGPSGTGVFVPKLGDEVHQIVNNTKTEYVVAAVDPVTELSTLRPITGAVTDGEFTMNVLFGVGPGTQADTYLAYVDKSVTPYRLTVEARLRILGSQVAYAKFFSGSDLSAATGTVISQVYDTGGNYIGENVPVELAATIDGHSLVSNTAVNVIKPCFTHANLADGDVITAVLYDLDGFVCSKRELGVWNTGFVRGLDAAAKEVIDITLETPFLAASNSTQINYPVNLPLNSMNLVGVVSYSDGSQAKYGVDGTKFAVEGLDAYAPTIVGQEVPITIIYQLQQGETAYGADNQNSNHIARTFTVITQAVNGSYAIQLYCYPEWVSPQAGYTLRWWMYDLNRSVATDVTPYVVIDTSKSLFQPTNYGAKQTLQVFLNLSDVNASYNDFYHNQIVDVVLNFAATNRPAHNTLPDWQVTATSGTVPLYGQGVFANNYAPSPNSNQISLAGDFTDFASWLAAYYGNTVALHNPTTETVAPNPTHFAIIAGGIRTEYPITQWNQQIVLSQVLTNNSTIYLQFFKRTTQADLQLSVAGVPLRFVDSVGNFL